MALVEAALVFGLLGAVVYAVTALLLRPPDQRRPSSLAGTWRAAHYDAAGETHVVLQKVAEGSTAVLDEHVVATVRTDDPDYDDKFLAAMDAARRRQALFETEEGA